MGHEPAFKIRHPECLGIQPAERDVFWQSLSNAHGRLYFAGHDHFYDHMRLDDGDGDPANDLHQMVVGTGGAPLHPDNAYDGINDFWTPVRIFHEQQFGYVKVEIDGLKATATWWHRVGAGTYASTSDTFAYTVPLPAITLACSIAGGQLTLAWMAGTLQTAPNANGPYVDVPRASSPLLITNCIDPRRFYRLRLN